MKFINAASLLVLIGLNACENAAQQTVASTSGTDGPVLDTAGNLRVPRNYLTTYETLGSWAVAADSRQGSKEMHIVYASPGTINAYRKTGRWPDGAVLVKEVRSTVTAPMTTGTVSHPGALKGWFVMVKDGKNSHPQNKLWGDGWGWSWFDAAKPLHTTSSDYKVNCRSCHMPAQKTDWIYAQGYPKLTGSLP
ncbi:cytochrome P460 family protein [Sphingosinicellaceae bacterium]|nr:cytochrome P460 family protein [Sphingosinicellaceae bacterium]